MSKFTAVVSVGGQHLYLCGPAANTGIHVRPDDAELLLWSVYVCAGFVDAWLGRRRPCHKVEVPVGHASWPAVATVTGTEYGVDIAIHDGPRRRARGNCWLSWHLLDEFVSKLSGAVGLTSHVVADALLSGTQRGRDQAAQDAVFLEPRQRYRAPRYRAMAAVGAA